MSDKRNLLFICSRNKWRSPTAEKIWHKDPNFNARSAGTSPNAVKTISPKDIGWADIIFVMEKGHKSRIMAQYARLLEHKPIHILDIPDEYQFMDPELIEELEARVTAFL